MTSQVAAELQSYCQELARYQARPSDAAAAGRVRAMVDKLTAELAKLYEEQHQALYRANLIGPGSGHELALAAERALAESGVGGRTMPPQDPGQYLAHLVARVWTKRIGG